VVNGLVSETVLYRSSNMSALGTTFPFNIQPWAWDYLNEHPELLNG
jgi:Super-infection exclusion protein B